MADFKWHPDEPPPAIERLNQSRTKTLHFDFKYYFVDIEAAHTNHLQKVLDERGYQVDSERLVVLNSRFEDTLNDIIAEIRRGQPRAGRSFFLLDQCGF